jgi:ankyrin repeat protein
LDEQVISFLKLSSVVGADKNKVDQKGCTPLILASQRGQVDAVLVDAGAGRDHVDTPNGMSALHWAAMKGNLEIARILL